MRKNTRLRYDAHVRTKAVCTQSSAILDSTGGGKSAHTALDTKVAEEERHLAIQERTAQERAAATEQIRRGRLTLRAMAAAVVKVGRLVDLDEPLMDTLQLPGLTTDDGLLAYMRGLLDRVSPHADAFVAAGLPPDLLQNAAAEVDRFAAAKDGLANARHQFAASAVSLHLTQVQAAKTIDALVAIAVNTPAANPELVTKLRLARRIGPRQAAEPPAASPSPAPPTAPVPPASSTAPPGQTT